MERDNFEDMIWQLLETTLTYLIESGLREGRSPEEIANVVTEGIRDAIANALRARSAHLN